MSRKYTLTKEKMIHEGRTLYRIRSCVSIPGVVAKGDFGGWVQSENNLSHRGTCWVYPGASVYDNAQVRDNARVGSLAEVYDHAVVKDDSVVDDFSKVFGYSRVYNSSRIINSARVFGSSAILGSATIGDGAEIFGHAHIGGCARIFGIETKISGEAYIDGPARISKGHIDKLDHFFLALNVGSENGVLTTWVCSKAKKVYVNRGCFTGTLQEFETAVNKRHRKGSKNRQRYEMLIAYIKLHFKEFV